MLTAEEKVLFAHLRDDIEQISAAASHDLRDHLREAMKYCQDLREMSGLEAQPLISRIEECMQDTMDNVAALRQYAYLAQNLERAQPMALEDVMARAREHFAQQLIARHAHISWSAGMHAPLLGRPAQLELLFRQLFDNGLKYNGSAQPEVHVTVNDTGHFYEISVQDNGEGMEPEFASLVLGLFKRVNPDGVVKGSGAGLAYCKKVAENHGGSIAMQCEIGYGCRVVVTLPHVEQPRSTNGETGTQEEYSRFSS
jgi:light-regulated signal transduction histidine kinase (bacteriophytochrome)